MNIFGIDEKHNWNILNILPIELRLFFKPLRNTVSIAGLFIYFAAVFFLLGRMIDPTYYLFGINYLYISLTLCGYLICCIERRLFGIMLGISIIVIVMQVAPTELYIASWPVNYEYRELRLQAEIQNKDNIDIWQTYEITYRHCITLFGFLILTLALISNNIAARCVLILISATVILFTVYVRGPYMRKSFYTNPWRNTSIIHTTHYGSE